MPLLNAIINPSVVIKSGVVRVSILKKLSVELKLDAIKKPMISVIFLWISQLEIIKDNPRVITSALNMYSKEFIVSENVSFFNVYRFPFRIKKL